METTSAKNIATITHLSTLTQYFIPFGNFIFPLIIWSSAKKDSTLVDSHGREVVNFQLSIFLYTLILCAIAIPVLLFSVFKAVPFSAIIDGDNTFLSELSMQNMPGIVAIAAVAILILAMIKIGEFFLVIFGSVKAANGEPYQYPLRIRFIK